MCKTLRHGGLCDTKVQPHIAKLMDGMRKCLDTEENQPTGPAWTDVSEEAKRAANHFNDELAVGAPTYKSVEGINWHIQTWRHQQEQLDKHWQAPEEDKAYHGYDCADRCGIQN